MVHITVDTEKDSANTIRRVITILEDELRKKDDGMMSDYSSVPSYSAPSNPIEARKVELNNPFAMFNDSSSSSEISSTPSSSTSVYSEDNYDSELEEKSEEIPFVQMYDEHTTDKIILQAPPQKQSSDFEQSARFAKHVELKEPERKHNSSGFFSDLDDY
jgi:hypothetical protein